MRIHKVIAVQAVILVSLLFVYGCYQVPASTPAPTVQPTEAPTAEPTLEMFPSTFAPTSTSAPTAQATSPTTATQAPPAKMEILLQKAYAIADKVTQEAQGLLAVTYAEIPDHGNGTFGVHYNVFIIKRVDLLTSSDFEKVRDFVAEILELTTQEIIVSEPSITHMGVQLVTPDFWFYGGHKRGPILVFEAARAQLFALGSKATPNDWIKATQVNRFDSDDFWR